VGVVVGVFTKQWTHPRSF